MKNIILVMLVVLFCNFANAQGLGNLLGGNKDGGANPLGNLLGGGRDKGANPLGNLLGGDKKNPLGSMLGGKSDGKKGGAGNFMSVIGESIEAMENVNLGPVGKFMLGRKLYAMVIGKYPNLLDTEDIDINSTTDWKMGKTNDEVNDEVNNELNQYDEDIIDEDMNV